MPLPIEVEHTRPGLRGFITEETYQELIREQELSEIAPDDLPDVGDKPELPMHTIVGYITLGVIVAQSAGILPARGI